LRGIGQRRAGGGSGSGDGKAVPAAYWRVSTMRDTAVSAAIKSRLVGYYYFILAVIEGKKNLAISVATAVSAALEVVQRDATTTTTVVVLNRLISVDHHGEVRVN
jgi:hypothetical protein